MSWLKIYLDCLKDLYFNSWAFILIKFNCLKYYKRDVEERIAGIIKREQTLNEKDFHIIYPKVKTQ